MTPVDASNRRILIIDDNPAIHTDFRKILVRTRPAATALSDVEDSLFGDGPSTESAAPAATVFELDSAHQGKEGFGMVQTALDEGRPYALAFVDVRMPPGWDGIETIKHICGIDPNIQIVICTAYSDYSWEEMTGNSQAGNILILKKPFDNIEVIQMAHALTSKWNLALQVRHSMDNLDKLVAQRTADLNRTLTKLQTETAHRSHAQASLRVSEERFSKAFRASPFPMGIVNLNTDRYEDCNDALLKMISRDREEILVHTSNQFNLWADPKTPARLTDLLIKENSVANLDLEVLDQNGKSRKTLVSAETFSLGKEIYALLIWQDLSERLRLEGQLRQSQKMEAVGQLAAGVAHDFNNILTVIQGHASLRLAIEGVDSGTKESLEQISVAAERAATLTRQLLAFSRKQIMQLRGLDLNATIKGLHSMLHRLIGEHIQLTTSLDASISPIHADNGSIEQVIMNLVVNARDAMPGGGSLQVATSEITLTEEDCQKNREASKGDYVCLSVLDSGCGMDEATRQRIFEPFFTTKEVGKGTGMGLATVYGIIQQHNGWLEVESQPDKGSTFKIFLPRSETAVTTTKPIPVPSPTAERGSETILIVEDEENLRLLVDTILTELGYKTMCAENGVEALKIWAKHQNKIDLLLTDIVMPEAISGLQLAERMLKTHPRLKVIYTSGYSIDLIAKGHPLSDGQNFLPKPYPPIKLANTVRACLDVVLTAPKKPSRAAVVAAPRKTKPKSPEKPRTKAVAKS